MTRSPSLGLRIEEEDGSDEAGGEVKKISHFRVLSVEKVEGKEKPTAARGGSFGSRSVIGDASPTNLIRTDTSECAPSSSTRRAEECIERKEGRKEKEEEEMGSE